MALARSKSMTLKKTCMQVNDFFKNTLSPLNSDVLEDENALVQIKVERHQFSAEDKVKSQGLETGLEGLDDDVGKFVVEVLMMQ